MLRPIVFSAFLALCSTQAFAADQNPQCRAKPPYSIQVGDAGLEVRTALQAAANKKLSDLGNLNVAVGAAYVRAAYGAAAEQAMGDVFDYWVCVTQAAIAKSTTLSDSEKQRQTDALDQVGSSIKLKMLDLFDAYTMPTVSLAEREEARTRIIQGAPDPNAGPIDIDLFRTATAGDLEAIFINVSAFKGWIVGDIPGVELGVCGGYVKKVLADNAGPLQRAVAATRQILELYIDPKRTQARSLAMTNLALQVSATARITVPAGLPPLNSQFTNCAANVSKSLRTS